ncbi:hypothetical protein BV20DRAFT_1021386 [Pilatotrama ljubarskyi]|nr:hypothetical protein BV20DRAFT_1021386 [Pilatotrama ljubarskyi]
MHNKITCITYDAFMGDFVPEPTPQPLSTSAINYNLRSRSRTRCMSGPSSPPSLPPSTNPLQSLPLPRTEVNMYDTIITALNEADLCPGYQFASTPHKGDPSEETRQAVDCGMYSKTAIPKLGITEDGGFGRTDWSSIEIAIECKMHPTEDDPFDERTVCDEPNAATRRKVLGQILSYMELIFRRQQRTFQFMLLFIGGFVRIIRVDRSGLFATEQIDYRKDGNKLAVFLWRYARLSATLRGHDTTAARLEPDSAEAQRMRDRVKTVAEDDYVARAFKDLLDEEWAWWKLEVPDETNVEKSRFFLVTKPHFQAPGVAGRTTRGHIALEATPGAGDDFVYLKDAWRVVMDGIEKEGVVLEKLRKKEISYVPTLMCHGDIVGQETVSQAVWPKYHPGQECKLKRHQHYRLVVKEVGKPLDQFSRGLELVLALWCCITAHAQAYQAGIIHRDISAGNLLLYKGSAGWVGLLNDWELSKELEQQMEEGRQPDRTGTWQFMSAFALNEHTKTIVIQDELESFFHVLLYIAVRLLPHNCEDSAVPQFLYDYFDDFSAHPTGHGCGATKYGVMCGGVIPLGAYNRKKTGAKGGKLNFLLPSPSESPVKTTSPTTSDQAANSTSTPAEDVPSPSMPEHPLNDIVRKLLSWFSAYYNLQLEQNSKGPAPSKQGTTQSSDDDVERFFMLKAQSKAWEQKHAKEARSPLSLTATTLEDTSDDEDLAPEQASPEELQKRAKQLSSHAPILKLLETAVTQNEWPKADRCPDRKPKKGWKPDKLDQVPKGDTIHLSKKRGSEVVDNLPSPRSKRSRV